MVEAFKGGDDFQMLLEPTFIQGFKNVQRRASQCYPTLKFSDLDPLVDEEPILLTDVLLKALEEANIEVGGKEAAQGGMIEEAASGIDVNV